ncbi:MAG: thioredoxin [Gemmatimonadales bacterium]
MPGTNTKTAPVTDASFAADVEQSKGLVLVDFWATWCGPCLMIAPSLEQLASEYEGQMKVLKLDVDENQRTAMRFNVRSIPSILFFKDGKVVDTVVGALPKPAIEAKVKQHLG